MSSTVLIISEQQGSRQAVSQAFTKAGFHAVTSGETAATGTAIRRHRPAAVVIASTPSEGIELFHRVRGDTDVPVVLSPPSHTNGEELRCLAAGLDDYVPQQADQLALVMRTERLMRRWRESDKRQGRHQAAGVEVDLDARTARYEEEWLQLTRTEFDLLALMVAARDRVVHRKEMVDRVWGAWYGDDHMLEVHLSRLRRKIQAAGGPRLVVPVRGIGYRLQIGQSPGR